MDISLIAEGTQPMGDIFTGSTSQSSTDYAESPALARQRGAVIEISGLFNNQREINRILDDLHSRGYGQDDISVIMTEKTRDQYYSSRSQDADIDDRATVESKTPEGATAGGLTGGLLGALLGGLTLAGNVVAPGVGLLVAGPIVGALTGGAVGAATGGLIGALVGAGIPEEHAKNYDRSLNENPGQALVIAHVSQAQAGEIEQLFIRHGGQNVHINNR